MKCEKGGGFAPNYFSEIKGGPLSKEHMLHEFKEHNGSEPSYPIFPDWSFR